MAKENEQGIVGVAKGIEALAKAMKPPVARVEEGVPRPNAAQKLREQVQESKKAVQKKTEASSARSEEMKRPSSHAAHEPQTLQGALEKAAADRNIDWQKLPINKRITLTADYLEQSGRPAFAAQLRQLEARSHQKGFNVQAEVQRTLLAYGNEDPVIAQVQKALVEKTIAETGRAVAVTTELKQMKRRKKAEKKDEQEAREEKKNDEKMKEENQIDVNEVLQKASAGSEKAQIILTKKPFIEPRIKDFIETRLAEGKSLTDIAVDFNKELNKPENAFTFREQDEGRRFLSILTQVDPEAMERVDAAAREAAIASREPYYSAIHKEGGVDIDLGVVDKTQATGEWARKQDEFEEFVTSVQNAVNTEPDIRSNSDWLQSALIEIAKAGPNAAPDAVREISALIKAAEKASRAARIAAREAEHRLDRRFNNLSVLENRQDLMIFYPRSTFTHIEMEKRRLTHLWGDSPMVEELGRTVGRWTGYVMEKYKEDIPMIMLDPKYRAFIEAVPAYGPIDENNLTAHPFYQERVGKFRELSKELGFIVKDDEAMQRAYSALRSGLELGKVGDAEGNIGDDGLLRIANRNGGVTGMVANLYDTEGLNMDTNNQGIEQRFTGVEDAQLDKNVERRIAENLPLFQEVYRNYWETIEPTIPGLPKELQRELSLELTPQVMESIVDEARQLVTVKLRGVVYRARALSRGRSEGQNGQPAKYAGIPGGEADLAIAHNPIDELIYGWDTAGGGERTHLQWMVRMHGVDYGIDKIALEQVHSATSAQRVELGRYALSVVEQRDTDTRIRLEKERLAEFFKFKDNGEPNKNLPTRVEDLTDDQLARILAHKHTVPITGSIWGGYGFDEASWVVSEKQELWKRMYEYHGVVGLEYQKVNAARALITAESHEATHDAQHKFEEVLGKMADIMPQQNFRYLVQHKHFGAIEQYGRFVQQGIVNTDALGAGAVVDAGRPDAFWKQVDVKWNLTDELCAREGLPPIPYGHSATISIEQWAQLDKVFGGAANPNAHVHAQKYVDMMQAVSAYVGDHGLLKELTKPIYFDSHRYALKLDARERFLYRPSQAKGSHADVAQDEVDNLATRLANAEGAGGKSGIARVTKDNGLAKENGSLLSGALMPESVDDALKGIPDIAKGILFSAGQGAKYRAIQAYFYSYLKTIQMDGKKDWLIYGHFQEKTSIAQRTVSPSMPSLGLNDAHHAAQRFEAKLRTALEMETPETTSDYEKQLGLIFKFALGGQHIEIKRFIGPVQLYQYTIAGLALGAGGLLVGKEEAEEGLGGGGGGAKKSHH